VTDWSVLGGDPAPGSPDVFSAVAQALQPVVDQGESGSQSIRGMAQQAGSVLWSGKAADTFAESVHVIPVDLGQLVGGHQAAIGALNNYSGTLSALQQQASQALANAQSAQDAANSASTRLARAEASYSQANEDYWYYLGKVDVLEVEKRASDAAGNHTESARLEAEIGAATNSRNEAWSQRAGASADISSATSARNAAQTQVADEQAIANGIAAQRGEAISVFVGQITAASEFVVGERSWIDRISHDFDSVAATAWTAAKEILDVDPSHRTSTKGDRASTKNRKAQSSSPASLGAAAAAAAATSSESASRLALMSKFESDCPTTVGSGWCTDLFNRYTENYFEKPFFVSLDTYDDGSGNASDLYYMYWDIPQLYDNFSILPATAVPQPGDVAVWSSPMSVDDGAGHVAIVTSVSGTTNPTVGIIQQNADNDRVVSTTSYTVPPGHPPGAELTLLGYLRPDQSSLN